MQNKDKLADRAKQFMPFDALTGYRQAIKEKEKVVVARKQLSEDDFHILNERVLKLHLGDLVRVIHYYQDEYIETIGMLSKVDFELGQYIQVVNKRIGIQDIIEIDTENT